MNTQQIQRPTSSRVIVIELHDDMWNGHTGANPNAVVMEGKATESSEEQRLNVVAQGAESGTNDCKAGLVALRKTGWTIYLSTPNFGGQVKAFHEALSKLLRSQGIAYGRHSLVRNLLVISMTEPAADQTVAPAELPKPAHWQAIYTETLCAELGKMEADVYVCASSKMLCDVGTIMGPQRVRLVLFGRDEHDDGQKPSAMAEGTPQAVQEIREEGVGEPGYDVAFDWKQLVEMCSDGQSARRASA